VAAADPALIALPALAYAFVLVLCRVGGACMLLPGVGEMELPAMLRMGFALALTFLLVPLLAAAMPRPPADPWRLLAAVAAEIGTGVFIGWLARLAMQMLPVAGQFIATMCGLANVLQPDPALGAQTTAIARALGLAAPVVVLSTGLHALPLAALAASYDVIPAGTLLPASDSVREAIRAVSDTFAMALQLSAPFLLAATLWQVALGLISRLVPQLQVFFAAMPGQIAGGLLLLALLAQEILTAWQNAVQNSFSLLPGH
jgi:flagellar biosynthetic protein FliR